MIVEHERAPVAITDVDADAGFVPAQGDLTTHSRCAQRRTRQTVAQLLGPMLLTAIIADLPTVVTALIALARRWMAREARIAQSEADQAWGRR